MEPSNELSALLDRSPADIRGVKYGGSPGQLPLCTLPVCSVESTCKTQVSNVYSRYTSLHFWRAYESELSLSWFLTHMSHPASLIKLLHWLCCLSTFFCRYLECVTGGQWLLPAGASSLSPGAQSPLSGSMTARGTPPSGSMTARGTPRGLRSEPSAFGYGNTTPSGSSTSRATTPKFSTTPSRPTSATKSATQSRYHLA